MAYQECALLLLLDRQIQHLAADLAIRCELL